MLRIFTHTHTHTHTHLHFCTSLIMVLKGSPGTVLSTFEDWIIQVRRSKQLFFAMDRSSSLSPSLQDKLEKTLILCWWVVRQRSERKCQKQGVILLQILDVTNHHLVVQIQVAFSSFQQWNRPWKLYWGQIPQCSCKPKRLWALSPSWDLMIWG